jgi:branched-subunit amino acid aminotransferase/4-amino-4-deoxychorismate lyase
VLLEIGASHGITVEEQTLFPEDLFAADEVFISSTNRSLIGVGEIEGHEIAVSSGPVAQKLEKAFSEYVREYVEAREAAPSRS